MRIKKFLLRSKYSEEIEFEVTRTTITRNKSVKKYRSDDNGNQISAREPADIDVFVSIDEEISAVSLPSRTAAEVEIIEMAENPENISTKQSVVEDDAIRKPIIIKHEDLHHPPSFVKW